LAEKRYYAAMASLMDLPEELMDKICEELSRTDVVNLRIACRDMKEKTYYQFTRKHFGTQKVMITRDSLQSLIDFAKSKTFGTRNKPIGSCVRELCISAVSFPGAAIREVDGLPLDVSEDEMYRFWKDEEAKADLKRVAKKRRKAQARLMHEQRNLRKRGEDVKLLVEALMNLPAVDTITIVLTKGQKTDPKSESLYPRLPWGMKRVRQEIGMYPESNVDAPYWRDKELYHSYQGNLTWIVCVALSAIAKFGIKLKKFSIEVPFSLDFEIPKNLKERSRTPIPTKTLSVPLLKELKGPLSTLKTLTIAAAAHIQHSHDARKDLAWIGIFTQAASDVEDFCFYSNNNFSDQLTTALATGPAFPRLRILRLHKGDITLRELERILDAYTSTLERLEMTSMQLAGGTWVDVLRRLQKLPHLRSLIFITVRESIAWQVYIWVVGPGPKSDDCGQSVELKVRVKSGLDMVKKLDKQIFLQTGRG
jgi:hypothetical protein